MTSTSRFSSAAALLVLIGCSSGGGSPTPPAITPPPVTGPPTDAVQFTELTKRSLDADGDQSGLEAYDLIRNFAGPNPIEAPDLYPINHPAVQHIYEDSDATVGNHFVFVIHRDIDIDRDRVENDDRQRNEIKTYDKSEEAVALGAECLVLVVGGLPDGSRDIAKAREQVFDGMSAILEHARSNRMPLAIEPLHPMYAADRACVNTMQQALDICDRLGEGTGVAVDVYHVWWDPQLAAQIARAGDKKQLLAFHVCDWIIPTRDLLLDRGMMGDGIIELKKIRGWVEAAGYDGCCEVEIFSSLDWWQKDPDYVLTTCVERHQSVV